MKKDGYIRQEIYLTDVIWKLIEQWKALMLIGIVFALILTTGLYWRDYGHSTPKPDNNSTVLTKDVKASEQYKELSDAFLKYANYACQKQEYDRSFWNSNDYRETQIVSCIYEYSSEKSDIGISTLTQAYFGLKSDNKFRDTVIKSLNGYWTNINKLSIDQVMRVQIEQDNIVDDRVRGTISIDTILPPDADPGKWEETLTGAIIMYCKGKDGLPEGCFPKLVILRSDQTEMTNYKDRKEYFNFVSKRNSQFNNIITLQASYEKSYNAMDKENRAIVDRLIDETDDSIYVGDYLSLLEKTLENKAKEASSSNQEVSGPGRSYFIKNSVIGFMLGFIIYVGVFFTFYVFMGVARNENELSNVAGIKNFGAIYEYPDSGKLAPLLHDKRVFKHRTRRGRTIELICTDIVSKLNFMNKDKLKIVSLGKESVKEENISSAQLAYLRERGIDVSKLNIADLIDSVKESEIIDIDCVLIEVLGDKTRLDNLQRLYSILREYDITVIGSEYIDV